VPYVESRERYFEGMGLARSGIDLEELQRERPFPDIRISKLLSDGDGFDLGGMTLEILHAPGHTPGHLAFRVNGEMLLFTSDVALNPFGPFYGNDFADIDDYIATIRKLRNLLAKQVITSHSGPFQEGISKRFADYEEAIYGKDRALLSVLERPAAASDLAGKNLFYPFYVEPVKIIMWFEQIEIEKHLERLLKLGKVRREGERYVKAS
jgi:glyoxylase-like metal-dependent hydrolase (beta-lactamase superfamily II)